MAKIETPSDLFQILPFFSDDCKIKINQLYNTRKNVFLKPLAGICGGIKRQAREILENEFEHPKNTFYVKTSTIKIIYTKEPLEIINVIWISQSS